MAKSLETMLSITSKQFNIPICEIKPEHSFIDDLGADSLDTLEVVMTMEEEFGMEISDSQAGTITTINDAADLVRGLTTEVRNTNSGS